MNSDIGLPFISALKINDSLKWQMSRAEKYALIHVLETLQPEVSIEIGTFQGGSLQVISRFSKEVYSLDISKAPSKLLSNQFPNVFFKIGNSVEILADIFEEIEKRGKKLAFILVDGDHSKKGVQNDLEAILNYPHKNKITIILHDSFNPQCRAGIKAIDFKAYKSVEYIEVDYITGAYSANNNFLEMWGGFAMIQLNPSYQGPSVPVLESQRNLFRLSHLFSKHIIKDPLKFLVPVKRKVYALLGKKHGLDMYDNFED